MAFPLVALQLFGAILEAEINASALRESAKRDVRIAELQAASRREHLKARAEIFNKVIDASRHVFDRKADLLQSSFDAVLRLIEANLADLRSQERATRERALLAKTKADRLAVNQHMTAIATEKAELIFQAQKVHSDMLGFLTGLGLEVPVSIQTLQLH